MTTEGVFLITGGTRGIGFGIATVLASKGNNLILGYNNNTERANKAKQELLSKYGKSKNIKIILAKGDTRFNSTLQSYLTIIKNEFNNKLIGIIFNAGGYPGITTKSSLPVSMKNKGFGSSPGMVKLNIKNNENKSNLTYDDHILNYYLNIYGISFIKLLEECYSLMKWCKNGRFIYISSPGNNATSRPSPFYLMPGIGKSFGEYLVRQYAKVYAKDGITVNCIIPGAIKTDAFQSYPKIAQKKIIDATPAEHAATPTDVGYLVNYLCSKKASFLTGVAIPFDGGFHLGPAKL